MMSKSTWVVIPAFNEGKVLATTISDVLRAFQNVVIVDDCSTDDTYEVALESTAHVCRHMVNLGQGASLQTGIEYALREGADCVITFDADGQHRVEDAVSMVHMLQKASVDVVLASRFLGTTEGMSWQRGALLKAATIFTRVTTGLALTDTHNGLRVFSRSAAQAIQLRQNRMAHASEILSQIGSLGLRYREYPVTILYSDYSKEKGQKASSAISILADLLIGRLYK